jgi:5-keto 4-deoxyuronate isomerase
MRVRYTLTMDDLTVDGEHFDTVVLDWEVDTTQDEVMRMSEKWITAQDFLTRRMLGLTKVGESSLTIEPIEESVNEIQGSDGRDF